MNVGAFTNGLLKTIGEVSDRASHTLAGHRQDRPDAVLCHNDINVLRLESSQDSGFGAVPAIGIVFDTQGVLVCWTTRNGGVGLISCGEKPPSSTRRQVTYSCRGLMCSWDCVLPSNSAKWRNACNLLKSSPDWPDSYTSVIVPPTS